MTTLPLSEVKARLSEIAEDLESIEATLELLADPEAQDRLRAAEADIAAGEVLDERAVRDLVSRHRHQQSG
jgi:antitoxin YefM